MPDNMIETALTDPAASDWLRAAIKAALDRDPVDACNDAEYLAEALRQRLAAL